MRVSNTCKGKLSLEKADEFRHSQEEFMDKLRNQNVNVIKWIMSIPSKSGDRQPRIIKKCLELMNREY